MRTHQTFVAGNWKMNTNAGEAERLARAIVDGVGKEHGVRVAICPPFPYLALVAKNLNGSTVALGAQNLYPAEDGAFTGEVSPAMLIDLGCRYVILGHSERRHVLRESDTFINKKVRVALASGLDVIFCVGETLAERDGDQTKTVLDCQLIEGLAGLAAENLPHLTIAYEPVWAIGDQRKHPIPQQAQEATALIRRRFAQIFDENAAHALTVQYGGSVKPENAASFLSQTGVDGVLIGGASLHADQFLAIVRAAIPNLQTAGEFTSDRIHKDATLVTKG